MLALALTLAAPSGNGMGEFLLWATGVIVALGAIAAALTAIFVAIRHTWRWFWHKFIPWVVRAVKLVDSLTDMPETVAEMRTDINSVKGDLQGHLLVADENARLLTEVREQVALLPSIAAQTTEVVGQVKNNGGSSLLDSSHRIEKALGLSAPEPNRPDSEAGTGPVPVPEESP